jgi:hypothetical protein
VTSAGVSVRTVKAARKLLEKGWCRFTCALTKGGEPTDLRGKDAKKFCATGAMARVLPGQSINDGIRVMQVVLGTDSPINYNDSLKDKRQLLRKIDNYIKEQIKCST